MPQHHLILKAASKDSLEDRPKDGMLIALNSMLKHNMKKVTVRSLRLQFLIVKMRLSMILILNSHCPTIPRTDLNENELLTIFGEIERVVEEW